MIDKFIVAKHFAHAASSYENKAEAQRNIVDSMIELMHRYMFPQCARIYEVGCGVGVFTRKLVSDFNPETIVANDICWEMSPFVETHLSENNVSFVTGDAESLDIPERTNAIVSCSAIQWFANIPSFIRRSYNALPQKGIFAVSTFGKNNFEEIRTITGQGLNYHSLEEYKKFLTGTGFKILHAGDDKITLRFSSAIEVLRHLRYTGVRGIDSVRMTPAQTLKFCRDYETGYNDANGFVSLTYHPVYLIAEKTD